MKYNIDTEKFMDYKCTAHWIFTSQTHLCNQHSDQENRILPAPQRVPSGSLPATTSHPWGCSFIQHFYLEIIIDSEEVGRRDVQGGPVYLSPNFLQWQYFCTTTAQYQNQEIDIGIIYPHSVCVLLCNVVTGTDSCNHHYNKNT